MKNIYKYGLSALCGSLATISAANAGSMTIAGGATTTHTVVDGVTGNPLGMERKKERKKKMKKRSVLVKRENLLILFGVTH
jgi:hypothetical protein